MTVHDRGNDLLFYFNTLLEFGQHQSGTYYLLLSSNLCMALAYEVQLGLLFTVDGSQRWSKSLTIQSSFAWCIKAHTPQGILYYLHFLFQLLILNQRGRKTGKGRNTSWLHLTRWVSFLFWAKNFEKISINWDSEDL